MFNCYFYLELYSTENQYRKLALAIVSVVCPEDFAKGSVDAQQLEADIFFQLSFYGSYIQEGDSTLLLNHEKYFTLFLYHKEYQIQFHVQQPS